MDELTLDHGGMKKDSINKPRIICGYQGFGMVGALAVNHLIEELDFHPIGSSQLREVPPVMAFKDGRMYKPLSILYNKKNNIVVIFILAPTHGIEWEIADTIEKIAKGVNSDEIIITDGITINSDDRMFYLSNYCSKNECKRLNKNAKPVKNSVVEGVTSALLMKDLNVLCFLGNLVQSKDDRQPMPPAKAAVNVIGTLNWYLDLKIGTKKLEELGDKMQQEFQKFISRLEEMKESKAQRYIG